MSWLYRRWARLLTWFGDIMLATSPPKVRAEHIRKLLSLALPGDIVCRKYIYYLDSYFIPGKYSHSGVVVDDRMMVHSVAEGVCYIDVIDFVKDCDGFILMRPPADPDRMSSAAHQMVGMPYDFLFDMTTKDAVYCHEMTYTALVWSGVRVDLAGDRVIADDIVRCCRVLYEVKT